MNNKSFPAGVPVILAILALLAASAASGGSRAADGAPPLPSAGAVWAGLLERRPYPYLIPLPEPKRTAIDGVYTKVVPSKAERVHCLRCPEYAPEGGVWKLGLDRGVFRVFHPESRWKSIGSYVVAGDRLLLANDPACIDQLGLYAWRRDRDLLVLEVIEDPCAIRLRAMNLTQMPWAPCRPPNIEAAVTGHWPQPEGCD